MAKWILQRLHSARGEGNPKIHCNPTGFSDLGLGVVLRGLNRAVISKPVGLEFRILQVKGQMFSRPLRPMPRCIFSKIGLFLKVECKGCFASIRIKGSSGKVCASDAFGGKGPAWAAPQNQSHIPGQIAAVLLTLSFRL